MILVINEWIFHDLLGENGWERFTESDVFVKRLYDSEDTIVMPYEERWKRKAYQLMTAENPAQRQVSQLFHRLLRDPDKCVILPASTQLLSTSGLHDWAPPEDVCLIEAFVASNADLLVTTDETLFRAIVDQGQFTCQMREDFLSTYGKPGHSS